jgi:tRNA-uridine 2-sulfurtransferase
MNRALPLETRVSGLKAEGDPLRLGKTPTEARVVVAMSGGVDSSVTAALLHELGYQVVGITLQLYDHGAAIQKKGACCAGADIADARKVAGALGIPHYVLDYESRFRTEVMETFADAYVRGETPIPCVTCNQTVKFRDLVKAAKDLGADALATGHYVRRVEGEHGPELHGASDPTRDQSYFLFATTPDQLEYLRFPLGEMPKSEVRALAKRYGLAVAAKPDSQDICFVPNGNYASVVERLRPGAAEGGNIVHVDGRVLGKHEGIIHFTIGQRKGIGVGGEKEPLFVVKLKPKTREVVVGPSKALLTGSIEVDGFNFLGRERPSAPLPISVKIRSAQPLVPARLSLHGDGRATIIFNEPIAGVAPGQAAVCYDGTRVIGGGWLRGR